MTNGGRSDRVGDRAESRGERRAGLRTSAIICLLLVASAARRQRSLLQAHGEAIIIGEMSNNITSSRAARKEHQHR